MALSVQEFSAKIKAKYPEYSSVDDRTLAEKVIAKYPEYKGKVDMSVTDNGAPNVVGAVSDASNQMAESMSKTMSGYQSPGSQFAKPWEYTQEDFMKSPIGQFAQKQAPQLQEALTKEGTQDFGQRLQNVGGQFIGGAAKAGGGLLNLGMGALSQLNPFDNRSVTEKADQAIGGLNDVIGGTGQVITSPLAISPVLQKGASLPFEGLHDVLAGGLKDYAGIDPESDHGRAIIDSFMNGVGLAAGGPKNVAEGITSALDIGKTGVNAIREAKPQAERIQNYKQQLDKSVSQITQGKTKDLEASKRALGDLDTTGVKSYEDLKSTINDKLEAVKMKQDEHLDQYTNEIPLEQFSQTYKKGNSSTKVNYVKEGLDQLEELYKTTKSPEDLVRIQDLKTKANTDGLTVKEANNIAREYGSNFGAKAFGKNGDPLTSVNSQAFENTRAGIKEAARSKLPTDHAKIMDDQMHDLITLDKNITKMVEKVNNLKQKVQERGLGEKAGRFLGETINTLSGGAVKGLIEKFLSRGSGLKTLNALDLEGFLKSNLQKVDKWSKLLEEKPYEFMKQMKKEMLALPEGRGNIIEAQPVSGETYRQAYNKYQT